MENAPPETPTLELVNRIRRFREAMTEVHTDILIVTSRANFEYLTDHRTLSWAYHARPCFAILTLSELIVVASRAEARNIARAERHFRTEVYDGFQAEAALAGLLTREAAWKYDQGTVTEADMSMAKLKATEVLAHIADEAIQIHGGMGLMDELPLERIWRDARVERIWEGTSEIQRHIISRELLRAVGG